MGACMHIFVKYLLFVFNLLCILLGLAVIVLGALNLTAHLDSSTSSQFLFTVPFVLLVTGGIILVIASFGCCGALTENRCALLTYSALITFIFILELMGGIALYSFYNEETIANDLTNSLNYYEVDKDVEKFWDVINNDLNCCGVQSYVDWGDHIPNSCCKDLDINDVCHKEQAYEVGCLDVMLRYMKQVAPYLISVVAALQLLSIVFAVCLARCNNYETV